VPHTILITVMMTQSDDKLYRIRTWVTVAESDDRPAYNGTSRSFLDRENPTCRSSLRRCRPDVSQVPAVEGRLRMRGNPLYVISPS